MSNCVNYMQTRELISMCLVMHGVIDFKHKDLELPFLLLVEN